MPCLHLNFRPVQFSLVFFYFPRFPSVLYVFACTMQLEVRMECRLRVCVCPRTFLSPSNVSAYQKSVICYLYKTRGLLFQSMPLVFLSFSLLSEMSNFSVTFPSSVSWYNERSLSHGFHSPPSFFSLSFGIFFFFLPEIP